MAFTDEETAYLRSQRLARIATVAPDGQPDVVPVGYEYDGTHLYVGGMDPVKTRKFRNVQAGNTKIALVIDDLVSAQPWTPRYLRIYGTADLVDRPGQFGPGSLYADHAHHLMELEPGREPAHPRPRSSRPAHRPSGDHMSFDTRAGTRGARQPSGPFFRWLNKVMSRRLRRKGGTMMGFNALVLTTVGAKSGARRTNPVGWFPGQDGSWLIVASAAGAARNPAWYYNIAAHPDEVQIEVDGRTIPVTAEQLHEAERDEAWQQITAAAPRFAQYEQKTDRVLPVIRLEPRSG